MTYPTSGPKLKHQFLCSKPVPSDDKTLLSEMGFSNSAELFRSLDQEFKGSPQTVASVYSYSDGPEYPGALARQLLILGVADVSLRYCTVCIYYQLFD